MSHASNDSVVLFFSCGTPGVMSCARCVSHFIRVYDTDETHPPYIQERCIGGAQNVEHSAVSFTRECRIVWPHASQQLRLLARMDSCKNPRYRRPLALQFDGCTQQRTDIKNLLLNLCGVEKKFAVPFSSGECLRFPGRRLLPAVG